MKNEISVLRYINKNGYTTQRDIAKLTGMSLGNVNAAIKSLIGKGFLEKKFANNEKDVRYILTDVGIREKSIDALNTYSELIMSAYAIKRQLEEIIKTNYIDKNKLLQIFADEDEIFNYIVEEILKIKSVAYITLKETDLVSRIKNMDSPIIVWHPDFENKLKNHNLEYINILTQIDNRSIKNFYVKSY